MKKSKADNEQIYLFHQGTYYQSYEYLGCHLCSYNEKQGAFFRIWAPNAKSVAILGDFNQWDNQKNLLEKISENGIWEIFVEGVQQLDKYKFEITDQKSCPQLKSDPYAHYSETNGKTASIVYNIHGYEWGDQTYLEQQKTKNACSSLSIFMKLVCHPGKDKRTEIITLIECMRMN